MDYSILYCQWQKPSFSTNCNREQKRLGSYPHTYTFRGWWRRSYTKFKADSVLCLQLFCDLDQQGRRSVNRLCNWSWSEAKMLYLWTFPPKSQLRASFSLHPHTSSCFFFVARLVWAGWELNSAISRNFCNFGNPESNFHYAESDDASSAKCREEPSRIYPTSQQASKTRKQWAQVYLKIIP